MINDHRWKKKEMITYLSFCSTVFYIFTLIKVQLWPAWIFFSEIGFVGKAWDQTWQIDVLLLMTFIECHSLLSRGPTVLMWFRISGCSLLWCVFEYVPKCCTYSAIWMLHGWCHMWCCCCLGTCSVYTIQPHTSLQCHFIQSHICRCMCVQL